MSLVREKNILGEPFNSNEDDTSFSLEKKVRTGFLSSNRNGGKGDDDIYAFSREEVLLGSSSSGDNESADILPAAVQSVDSSCQWHVVGNHV